MLHAYEDYEQREPALSAPLAEAFARIRPGTRVASICTGAFVLASAGLLDGRTATTHWRYADQFARLLPKVELDAGVLYTDGGVLTSAGCASGIDAAAHHRKVIADVVETLEVFHVVVEGVGGVAGELRDESDSRGSALLQLLLLRGDFRLFSGQQEVSQHSA